MKGFSLLLCLMVAFVSGTTAQGSSQYRCLGFLNKMSSKTGCNDHDAWISCLKKAIADPKKVLTAYDRMYMTNRLEYYRKEKEEDKPCSAFKKRDSCIRKEIGICKGGAFSSAREHCNRIPGVLKCLLEITEVCTTKMLKEQFRRASDTQKSCRSGQLKEAMKLEECYDEIDACYDDFSKFLERGDYEEALKELDPTMNCLDNLTCDGGWYLDNLKVVMNKNRKDYNDGLLTGDCTTEKLMTCSRLAEAEFSTDPSNTDSVVCDPDKAEAARTCLKDLEPHCTSQPQKSHYDDIMEEINLIDCSNDD